MANRPSASVVISGVAGVYNSTQVFRNIDTLMNLDCRVKWSNRIFLFSIRIKHRTSYNLTSTDDE